MQFGIWNFACNLVCVILHVLQARRQGNASPDFRSCPPDWFLAPPRNFVGRKKLLKKRLNFWFWPEKAFRFRRRPFYLFFFFFFWRSPVFGRKKRLNLRFWPEKAFRFLKRPFFFGDHLIFTETSPQSNSGIMKKLCPPDFNFAPPISRSWRRHWCPVYFKTLF